MHHAQLYIGEQTEILKLIGVTEFSTDPDVFFVNEQQFKIADARRLKEMAAQRPLGNSHRVFVLTIHSITTEAQNALLKLFEEPPATALFHIIVPREDVLIPTLRSRLFMAAPALYETASEEALGFLKLSYAKRLENIKERMKEKDEVWAEAVLRGSELYFQHKRDHSALGEILFARRYFQAPGASKKMLLEHLALTLPVVS